jgi:hypothetical protein
MKLVKQALLLLYSFWKKCCLLLAIEKSNVSACHMKQDVGGSLDLQSSMFI